MGGMILRALHELAAPSAGQEQYVPVAQWLDHCVCSANVVVRFPGNTHADEKCITLMHCKSLWIKASAKCININVR